MKRDQKGFGVVEGLLILIVILLVGFVGYYIYHTKNNTNSTSNSTGSTSDAVPQKSSSTTTLTLQDAITQTQKVYDGFFENFSTGGNTIAEGKPWDVNFINNHKTWFSSAFLTKANASSEPGNKYLLICFGGSAQLSGFSVSGDSLSGQTALVTVQEKQNGQFVDIKLPITLKAPSNSWLVEDVDTSSCN